MEFSEVINMKEDTKRPDFDESDNRDITMFAKMEIEPKKKKE